MNIPVEMRQKCTFELAVIIPNKRNLQVEKKCYMQNRINAPHKIHGGTNDGCIITEAAPHYRR